MGQESVLAMCLRGVEGSWFEAQHVLLVLLVICKSPAGSAWGRGWLVYGQSPLTWACWHPINLQAETGTLVGYRYPRLGTWRAFCEAP